MDVVVRGQNSAGSNLVKNFHISWNCQVVVREGVGVVDLA